MSVRGAGPAAAVAALVGAVAVGPAEAVTAPTIPGPVGPAEPSVAITLTVVEPAIPQPGDLLVIEGTVTNTSGVPLEHVQTLFRHNLNPLGSRADIRAVDDSPRLAWGSRPGHVFDEVADSLDPGQAADFHLEMVLETTCPPPDPGVPACVQIQHPGVYVVGVDVREGNPNQPGARVDAGTTLTFLPWLVDATERRVPVAMLWPIMTAPDGAHAADSPAALVGPTGWLRTLLNAPAGAPVTWAVDPELLATVATVAEQDGTLAAAAADSLERLRAATANSEAWLLPYATPDFAAFDATVAGELAGEAIRRARAAAAELPGARADVVWPVAGSVPEATLDVLGGAGYRTVVLDGAAARAGPDSGSLVRVPAGRRELTGVVTDAGLDAVIRAAGDDGVALRQRWLAETALAATDPAAPHGPLIVAPPPGWQPTARLAEGLIDVWSRTPWIEPVALGAFDPPFASVAELPGQVEAVLPAANVAAVTELHAAVHQYGALVGMPAGDDYPTALLRSASAFWRDDPERGLAIARDAGRELTGYLEQVSLQVAPAVTLSSNTGAFPVNVVNNLDIPVTVRLELRSANPDRMAVESVAAQRIEAGETEILRVTAEAVANGRVRVDMQLATVDGVPLGAARHTIVNATDYGLIGWFVIGGATLLFVAALAIRTVRGRRRNGEAGGASTTADDRTADRNEATSEAVPVDEVTR
jgi:hypothetical protein